MPIAGTGFEPYLGAGVGVTYAEVDLEFVPPFTIGVTTVPDLDDEVWIFTAQIMGGLTYHLTDNVAFFGGYRLRYLADTEYDTDQSFDDTFIQSVDVGVRISF
jgi:opacity protein-like surface antigen